MKNARVVSTDRVLQNNSVVKLYPARNVKTTPETTYADLSAIIKTTPDVEAWLECYEAMRIDDKLAALMFCRSYCLRRHLRLADVIVSHWELHILWLEGRVDTVATAVVATFYALIVEGGAL